MHFKDFLALENSTERNNIWDFKIQKLDGIQLKGNESDEMSGPGVETDGINSVKDKQRTGRKCLRCKS